MSLSTSLLVSTEAFINHERYRFMLADKVVQVALVATFASEDTFCCNVYMYIFNFHYSRSIFLVRESNKSAAVLCGK